MAFKQRVHIRILTRPLAFLTVLALAAALLGGCGLFGGAAEAPTPVPTRTPLPTFTPTSPAATPAAAAPPTAAPVGAAPVGAAEALTGTELLATTPVTASADAAAAPAPTATPAPATLTITSDLVNVRSGPGTEFDLVGTASTGETFTVLAKNAASDWWQVCCVADQNGWVFGELAAVQNAEAVAVAADTAAAPPAAPAAEAAPATAPAEAAAPAPVETTPIEAPTAAAAAEPTATPAPAALAPYDPKADSAGNFDPNAQYQITYFHVRGLDENNGGIRDTSAQHLIFVTVLDQNGNGVDGAVVRNLVGEGGEWTTGNKGPGMTEIPMYYEPFKLTVASDPAGSVTSQVSNQMGLIFPHLPDIVGKLGDVNYEYGVCPTIDIKCGWPLSDHQYVHFSYDITFQKVK
jgi:SH3-like domain-containing protein